MSQCIRCGEVAGYQLCTGCYSLARHTIGSNAQQRHGSAQLQETVVFAGDAKKHVDGLLDKLAASEKERERLIGELEFTKKMLERCAPAKAEFDKYDSMKRELENLKRSTNCELGDLRGGMEELERISADKQVRIAWLERELDRERAKNKKRGI